MFLRELNMTKLVKIYTLMWRTNQLIGKDTDAKKDWGPEKGAREWDSMDMRDNGQWRTGKSGMLQSLGSHKVGHYWATKHQQQILC